MSKEENKSSATKSGWALIPFLVFAVFYVGLSLYADHRGFDMSIDSISLLKCLYYQPILLLAVIIAVILPRKEKVALEME